MDLHQKEKLLKIHKGIVFARWVWIIIGFFRGEIMRSLQQVSLSPLLPSLKLGGISIILYLAIFQILFNLGLWIYLRFFSKNITTSGFKWLNFLQVYVDLASFTAIFYFTGSVESSGAVMLFIPLIISFIIYGQWGIIRVTISGCLLYAAVLFGQYLNIIPQYHAYANSSISLINNLFMVLYDFSTFVMSYAGAAIFGSLASKIIRNREEELIFERDKTSAMIKNLTDGLIMISQGTISMVNPKVKEYLDIGKKIIGKNIKTDFNRLPENLQKVLKMPVTSERQEFIISHPNQLTLELATVFVRNTDGLTLGEMKIIHDVSREKEMNRLKTEFISVASHQLRTPLSAIKWAIQMMLEGDLGNLNKDQKEFLAKGYESNEQMIRLVNDLLDISRIEEGRLLLDFSEKDLQKIVEDSIKSSGILIEKIKASGVSFIYQQPEKALPYSKIDSGKMQIVITNLLENAASYTREGSITVSLKYDDKLNQNILKISDTGIGIPESEKNRLFNKFFRAKNAKKAQTEGNGLGLFIIKNIIDKHGGKVWFDSKEDKKLSSDLSTESNKEAEKHGTTFYISLPAIKKKSLEKTAK